MKKKILKNWKRIAAVMLAAVMVVGSVNLSGIVVNADNEGSGDPSINPYYDNMTTPGQGTYVYNGSAAINNKESYYDGVFDSSGNFLENPYDVFGAATHVHLFAEDTIESTVHTHGNIFCKTANLGEVGTRVQNNTLMNTIPGYREESYIGGNIIDINASSDFDTLILGKDIRLELQDNGHRRAVWTNNRGFVKLDNTDPRYIFKESEQDAINFTYEFNYLRHLSSMWAGMGDSGSVSYENGKFTIDNNWDGTTNLYYTIPYSEWIKNSNGITITGMDTTQTKRGILVINIDMNGAPVGEDGSTSITLGGNPTVGTFSNKEYKTDQYGQCRIVYNIVDKSAQNNQYTGKLQFGNTVFGSILAPSAKITVGAVNGTVMARSIIHEGQESHRMDIWALSEGGTDVPPTKPNKEGEGGEDLALGDIENSFGPVMDENNPRITVKAGVDIIIHKTYGEDKNLPQNLDLRTNETVFALYKSELDANERNSNHIAMGSAKRITGNNDYAEVVISVNSEKLAELFSGNSNNGEIILYIAEIKPSTGYERSDDIYQYKISFTKNDNSNSFTVNKCEYVDAENNKYFECNNAKTTQSDEDENKPGGEDENKPGGEDENKPGGEDDSKLDGGDDSKPGDGDKSEDNTILNPEKPSSTPGTTTSPSTTPPSTTTPSTPSTPGTPNTPSTPSTPSTPTTTPGTPSTPNTWETPDGKVHFEILIEYEHIDSSSTPERIEELTTNTTIKITDKDGNDVTENVTKITWDPSRDVAVVTVEVPKPSEGFDTYYVVEDTDPADNELSHSEPGKGFTVAITSDGKVLFQEDGSATPTTELRFVNVETATDIIGGGGSNSLTSMTSAQTGERKLPWAVLGGGMSMIFIAGAVYVFRKKENIK